MKNIIPINIIERLKKEYPNAKCSLNFSTPFELVIAVMLSAQCTDERVNKITMELFKQYNAPEDYAKIDLAFLEALIHSCGFYKNKAKNIKECSKKIISEFNGQVPENINDLISLPGIGRKSANVIMLDAFNNPTGIAVDTHVKRISNKLGLTNNQNPINIELDLLKIFPSKYIKDINHTLILHGRTICTARNPKCSICCIKNYCKTNLKNC